MNGLLVPDDVPTKRSPVNQMFLILSIVLTASVFLLVAATVLIAVICKAWPIKSMKPRTAKTGERLPGVTAPRKISDAFLAGGDVEAGVWCPGEGQDMDCWSTGSSSSTGPEANKKDKMKVHSFCIANVNLCLHSVCTKRELIPSTNRCVFRLDCLFRIHPFV